MDEEVMSPTDQEAVINGHSHINQLPLPVTTPAARSQNKRPFTSQSPEASRYPAPSFLPPAMRSTPRVSSPSSAALTAFLDAKKGQAMTEDDLVVIDTLTKKLHAEVEADSPNKAELRLGGWSATQTPRTVRSNTVVREQVTPSRGSPSVFGNNGPAFSIGSSRSGLAPYKSSPMPIRYRGPGMSPGRVAPSPSRIEPLFKFASKASDGSAKKKQKTEESSTAPAPPLPSRGITSSSSMPSLSSSTSKPSTPTANDNGKSRVDGNRPHPLSQTVTASVAPSDPVSVGKRRAADIMKELIEEQTAAVEEDMGGSEPIVINPYDRSPSSTVPAPQPETRVYDSPRKSLLRASVKGTPKRGAAARLEVQHASPEADTWEMLRIPKPKTPAPSTPTKSNGPATMPTRIDVEEVEAVASSVLAPASGPSKDAAPAAAKPLAPSTSTPEPAPFKPFETPQLDLLPRAPVVAHSPSRPEAFESPSQSAALSSSVRKDEAPKFSVTAPKPPAPVEEQPALEISPAKKASEAPSNSTGIYLTAKEQALEIAKPALPFFTFTVSAPKDEEHKAAKEEAMKKTPPEFAFTLPDPSQPSSSASSAPAALVQADWVCGTCMLKNPASAKEKCTICEEPRPIPAPSSSSSSTQAPSAPAPAFGSGFAASSPAPTPFKWPSGSAPAPKAAGGEWTCGTCMLKNPPSATEKCTICESPR